MAEIVDESPAPNEPISIEEYNNIVAQMELVNVAVNGIAGVVTDRPRLYKEVGSLEQLINFACGFSVSKGEDGAPTVSVVSQEVSINVGEKESPSMALRFQLQLDFVTPTPFTQAFFDVFKNGPLITIMLPYARELAQNLTTRMNVPPVVMPLFKADSGLMLVPDEDEDGSSSGT